MSTPIFKAGSWSVNPAVVVSPDGLTVSNPAAISGYSGARAQVFGSGPLYYELTIGGAATSRAVYDQTRIGFDSQMPVTGSNQMELGVDLRGYPIVSNNQGALNAANLLSIGDVVMLAKDENGNLWAGKNGTWFSGGNPSTRTAPLATLASCRINVMPFVNTYSGGGGGAASLLYTANFSTPAYPVPTDFALFSDWPTGHVAEVLDTPIVYGNVSIPPLSVKVTETAKLGARHLYFSGRGRVSGTVKTPNTPVNTPVHRRVRLYRERDAYVVAEQWSDPVTGAYSFDYVDPAITYTVLSYDHTGNFRAVVADNLTPTLIPDFIP